MWSAIILSLATTAPVPGQGVVVDGIAFGPRQTLTCEQLDAEARRVGHWRKPEPPWGTFNVRLVGRVSVGQHAKRYLGDGTKTVLIEKLLSVSKGK